MENNPAEVLAIGEIALFLIGIVLSIILLSILLLPSLARFRVPHWVRLSRSDAQGDPSEDDQPELLRWVAEQAKRRGFIIKSLSEDQLVLTRDQATSYQINLILDGEGLSIFRHGDEVLQSEHLSILSGAGVAWLVIVCDEAIKGQGRSLEWSWDHEFSTTAAVPFSRVMGQAILLNPWR